MMMAEVVILRCGDGSSVAEGDGGGGDNGDGRDNGVMLCLKRWW